MRIGIFGSGQLAWMLGIEAKRLGASLRLIGGTQGDPASVLADEVIDRAMIASDAQKLAAVDGCDFITFESEFLDFSEWTAALSSNAKVFPALACMEKLADKWEQKKLFVEHGLPTARAHLYDGKIAAGKWIAKWSRQGYDGYGNFFLSQQSSGWEEFVARAAQKKAQIYLEEEIPFDRECALVVGRDKNGKFLNYPLMLSEQKGGICEWVFGPASAILPEAQKVCDALLPKLKKFVADLNYVGVMAFEFFYVDGGLLLNEVAPRVHNSGHVTLDAFNCSQFKLHLLAPMGFGNLELEMRTPNFAMKNLLGDDAYTASDKPVPAAHVLEEKSATVYWYGKQELRRGRKLGHVNQLFAAGATVEKMKDILTLQEEKAWAKIL